MREEWVMGSGNKGMMGRGIGENRVKELH